MGDRSPFGRPRINRANHAPPRDGAGLKFASTELVSIDAATSRRSPGWESLTEMGAGNAVQNASLGEEVVRRVNELAAISEDGDKLTRIFLTKELRAGDRSRRVFHLRAAERGRARRHGDDRRRRCRDDFHPASKARKFPGRETNQLYLE